MKKIEILGIIVLIIACATFWIVCHLEVPTFQGYSMAQWLQVLKTNTNTGNSPLKIVKITDNNKYEELQFEVPLSYDLLKENDFLYGIGKLDLFVQERALSRSYMCTTNGNLVLICNANDFNPGTNQVHIEFFISNPSNRDRPLWASGPIAEFVSSNVCRVNEQVDREEDGIRLWADLSVTNAIYNIELLDTNGNHIKTISGITTNGTINEQWNLISDTGKKYPFNEFNAVFHIARTNALSQTRNQTKNVQSP